MYRLTLAFALLLPVEATAQTQDKPKTIPITALDTSTIEIAFIGRIKLTGETKHITYTQPLPAQDDGQDLVSVEVAEQPGLTHELTEDGEGRTVTLTWTDPPAGELDYGIEVTVHRRAFDTPLKSTTKGKAPQFLKSGVLTKPDASIKKLAKELTEGSTSDLETALCVAMWIHENVEYDPGYSQDKSDKTVAKVLEVKRGTCDELSHLFIALCRCAGIPAREVSGLAHTGQAWGFHSWSEIRLGEQWVPVDATNAQIGFVDALHVAFARDNDDAKFQQGIQSLGTGMFSVLAHDMQVKIVKASRAKGVIDATMSFEPVTAPPGKQFAAVLTVKNPTSSWLAGPARLVLATGFTAIEPEMASFIVAPGGKQVIRWQVTSPADLEPGSTYWYRMGAVTFPHMVAAGKFTVASGLIGEIAAFKDAGGKAVVAVGLTNPLDEDHDGTLEICLFPDWEMKGDPLCFTQEKPVSPGKTEKVEIATDFTVSGNFAVEVKASLGGLLDRFVQKINVSTAE